MQWGDRVWNECKGEFATVLGLEDGKQGGTKSNSPKAYQSQTFST